jgi:putative phosphoribosyl transferase
MEERFANRQDAGRLLKEAILASVGSTGCADVLVLGLRAGGVPVAFEVARALAAPLDVFVVRKLELPGGDGVVMGHIAAGGVRVLDGALISARKIPAETIEEVARAEAVELARLEHYYRGRRVAPKMMGRTIVLVDDGLSSASTLRAAVGALGMYRPKRIVLAAPVMDPGVY